MTLRERRKMKGCGLKYFGARFYDEEVGRFVSQDPVKDGANWFGYCDNNPLRHIDQNGLWSVEISATGGGAIGASWTGGLSLAIDDKGNVYDFFTYDKPGANYSVNPGFDASIKIYVGLQTWQQRIGLDYLMNLSLVLM